MRAMSEARDSGERGRMAAAGSASSERRGTGGACGAAARCREAAAMRGRQSDGGEAARPHAMTAAGTAGGLRAYLPKYTYQHTNQAAGTAGGLRGGAGEGDRWREWQAGSGHSHCDWQSSLIGESSLIRVANIPEGGADSCCRVASSSRGSLGNLH